MTTPTQTDMQEELGSQLRDLVANAMNAGMDLADVMCSVDEVAVALHVAAQLVCREAGAPERKRMH